MGYRSREEAEPWILNDPIHSLGDRLKPDRRKKIEEEVEDEILEAFVFAERSPFPEPAELFTDVVDS
jgi:TPP-dependent pyruvate/acetoin dehydrogenase alpha subunit